MGKHLYKEKGAALLLAVLLCVSMAGAKGGGGGGGGDGSPMAAYCCYPPFITSVVPPNIMLAIDNSGSMNQKAYSSLNLMMTDTTTWYGYFDSDSNYTWSSNHWESDPTGIWPGNVLNWACMSRIDVAKKALIGGEGNKQGTKYRLESEGSGVYSNKYMRDALNYNTFTVTHDLNGKSFITITKTGLNPPINATQVAVGVIVDVPEEAYGGVLDQIGDKDGDEHWDDDAPLFGTWFFNDNQAGHVGDYLGDPDIIDLRNRIDNLVCDTWTPLAESYYEILCYFSQRDPFFFAGDYSENPQALHDPYYDKYLHDMVPCRRSFVLLITDGASTKDYGVPNSDLQMPNCTNLRTYYDGINPTLADSGTDYLDDVALYGHVNDMRPDKDYGSRTLTDDQSIALYVIYAFGSDASARFLLKEAAMCGGFEDQNGNKLPDLQSEWDDNGDSIPDNYFEATSGYELESSIMSAIAEMLQSITSGSAVGVATMGTTAGGVTAQAQFWPQKTVAGDEVSWIGSCNSLWLDPYGHLREDTDEDDMIHLINDYVVSMQFDVRENNVMVTRIKDQNGSGDPEQFDTLETVPIEQMKPIWDASKILRDMNPADRLIGTFVDLDKDGVVDAGETVLFDFPQDALLKDYLGCETVLEADSLIAWIRGYDLPDKRSRTIAGKVWKLGDVINSGASTVWGDLEEYGFIYGDATYNDYSEAIKDRRQTVYVGANDGMIHCFNAGVPTFLEDPLTPFRYDPSGYALGEEIWAYIPYNLLPHLQWLPKKDYCHVYYCDLKCYITDAQIFTPDATHPHGWGTLLIGAMRLGGMPISNESDSYSSAYFALDITTGTIPVPLWESRIPDLNLTTCYGTAVKVQDSWFLVNGSGPTTCSGESDVNAKVFVMDLATGQMLKEWTLPDSNSFVNNMFGVDWSNGVPDYTVDRIYFGACYWQDGKPGSWKGKIYRILTHDDPDPNTWTLDEIFNMDKPVTAEGSVATDDYNHLWIYFGSGRFFSDVDEADQTMQRFVGFRDDTTHATTVAGLYNVSNVWIDTAGAVHNAPGCQTFDQLIDTVNNRAGWWRNMVDLGERNLTTTLVFGGAVLFTTYVPTGDICSYGGEGQLWALYYRTGTAYVGGTDRGNQSFLQPVEGAQAAPERVFLGYGMPSEPSLYVSADETKVFVQAGGAILTPQTGIPGLPETGVIIWKGR
jgi:type IV pilus assembly protein PilY1